MKSLHETDLFRRRIDASCLKLERTLEVSGEAAEKSKKRWGADTKCDKRSLAVRGRNLIAGLPEEFIVGGEEIRPLIQPALRVALEEIPTEASVHQLGNQP